MKIIDYNNRVQSVENLDTVVKNLKAKISEYKTEANISGIEQVTPALNPVDNIFLNFFLQIKADPVRFVKDLDFNPVAEIIKQRFGCMEQCFLCGVSCSNGFECDGTKRKHTTELHRTPGLSGWHYKENKRLCFKICSSEVATDNSYYDHEGVLK